MQGILQGSCFFIDFLRGFHEEREAEFTMKGYTPQKKDKKKREGSNIFWNRFREDRNGRN